MKNALSVGSDVLRNTSPTGLACIISKCENHSVIVEREKKITQAERSVVI